MPTDHSSLVASRPRDRTPQRIPDVLDVIVLAGGIGPEREVSIESGRAVYEALLRLGHRAVLSDINPVDLSALAQPADFVFIALHGAFGEDGSLQSELDRRGIRYCGSGAEASRLAMDKVETKLRLREYGLPTPDFHVINGNNLSDLSAACPLPAVVKPIDSGSSVDVTIVRTPEELNRDAERVVSRLGRVLVERYVRGAEFTVAVLGDVALPVCQIRPAREFYDYHAKYVAQDTQYLFDFDWPADVIERMRQLSIKAFTAIGCRAFGRIDWMLDTATMEPFILELNTIPGFTSHSLVPKAAQRVGIGFDELCQRIIELSWEPDGR